MNDAEISYSVFRQLVIDSPTASSFEVIVGQTFQFDGRFIGRLLQIER